MSPGNGLFIARVSGRGTGAGESAEPGIISPMDRDEQIMLELIQRAGFTVEREALTNRIGPTTYRVTARDDAGHIQVVDADDELTALVELARMLGSEDLD